MFHRDQATVRIKLPHQLRQKGLNAMDHLYSTTTHCYPSYREDNVNFPRQMVDEIEKDICPNNDI